jgi:galacturonosyltransferase
MKKILIIGNNDVGLHNFRKELIERLISDGFHVFFSVPYGEKVEILKQTGAEYYPIEINRRGTNIKEEYILFREYRKLITNIRPDVVLTYTIKPNIYGGIAAKRAHIPCIATITGLGTSFQTNGWKAGLIIALYKYGISKNRAVFFQNKSNLEFFVKQGLVQNNSAVVVPGSGVNTDYFYPSPVPHDTINFLFVARIMREKGIEEFLEAAQKIKSKYHDTRFQLLGYYEEEIYRKKVEELASKSIIEYLGISSDTRREMAQADCIVLPSFYPEGMSNVLLEGAAMGLPLITTENHGCRETVVDGVSGFLCKPRDAAGLTESLERFLALSPEERREMGLRGREKVVNEFDRRIVVERYMEVIQNTLGDQR